MNTPLLAGILEAVVDFKEWKVVADTIRTYKLIPIDAHTSCRRHSCQENGWPAQREFEPAAYKNRSQQDLVPHRQANILRYRRSLWSASR
jgi:hypothetical protein